jgi:xylulokinase
MACFVGHDAGTGGVKSVLATADGRILARAFAEYPLDRPRTGWAEQDPRDWWGAIRRTTRELLARAAVPAEQVAAIGFAGQMLSLVPVDVDGTPTRPAVSWLDARADEQARRIVRRMGGRHVVAKLAGGAPTGKDIVAKVAWIRDEEPEVFRRTAAFLDATGYLVARATGKLGADPTAAGATGLCAAGAWSRLLATLCSFPLDKAPPIRPCTEVVGLLRDGAAADLGLAPGTPVVAGLADIAAAAVGSGALGDGEAHLYLGTSAWIGLTTSRAVAVPAHGIASVPAADGASYLAIGESETAGACVAWFLDHLAPDHAGPSLDALAREAEPGARGLLFLPWMFGERTPVPDTALRGGFVHLSLDHGREEMARAVYEGVALNLRWIVEAFARGRAVGPTVRAIGGGVRSDLWMQIVADVTGRTVERVAHPHEAGALGVALVAAVGVKAIADVPAIARVIGVERTFAPRTELAPLHERAFEAMRALAPPHARAARLLSGAG